MQYLGLLLAGAAAASAQAVTAAITPTGAAPAGCSASYNGNFEITIVTPAQKRSVEKRASCAGAGTAVLTLQNGMLMDADGRTGYIASNNQFQFDKPVQHGAIYTAGWTVCGNSSLALGPSAVFYSCQSGDFSNLYNTPVGAQCKPIAIDAVPCGSSTGPAVSQYTDGQPQAVTQITDGQPQAQTSAPILVSQYTDGQPQVPTALVSQITDGQPQAPTAAAPAPTIHVGGAAALGLSGAAAAAAAVAAALL